MDKYIGVDIGKTKIAIGIFSEQCEVLSEIRLATPKNAEEILNILKEQIKNILLTKKENIKGIGIASMGVVDSINGIIIGSKSLKNYKDIELVKIMENEFNIPTFIENDIKAASICEIGDYEGINSYIGIGTSMDVSTVIDGRILYGDMRLAGMVSYFRDLYSDYIIDDYIAGRGIAKRISKAKGIEISTEQFFLLLKGKDADAINIYTEALKCMVNLLKWINVILNPKKIVIGGGVITKQQKFFEDIKNEYIKNISNDPFNMGKAILEKSKYGEQSTMIGACKLCLLNSKK